MNYKEQAAFLMNQYQDELAIVNIAIKNFDVIRSINTQKALLFDRIIDILLEDQLDDDSIIGIAFLLGVKQGIHDERKRIKQRMNKNAPMGRHTRSEQQHTTNG